AVMGLRVNFKDEKNRSASQIEEAVLIQLKKFNLPQTLMIQFYTAIIESILTASITIWFGSSTSQERTKLQRIIRTAERIIGCNLPSLQQIYTSRQCYLHSLISKHFVTESKSWTEAQSYCIECYTDLATIDNMEEMNRLINTVNSSYSGLAWIGLYDDLDS
ncbi:hypothetical protein NFI96_009232, partial [Prochilodus magdalenae]